LTSHLFEHLAEVAGEIRAAAHLLLGLDFDGTLAPIVADPKDAFIPRDTRSILGCLVSRPDITVAIVSGRAPEDLASRVDLDVILAANHGLEIDGRGLHFREPQAESRRCTIHRIYERLSRATAGIPGALAEDKGLTASVHFRNVEDSRRDEIVSIVRDVAEADPDEIVLRNGNQVLEILPRVTWNKGSAVGWIIDRLRAERPEKLVSLCYLGDDVSDEDVFDALGGITIRVGGDAPSAARFGVRDTVEAAQFLQWLLSAPLQREPLETGA